MEGAASPTADGILYDYEGNCANSVISNALTSPTRPTGPDLAVAVLTDMFRSPQDMAATWQVSIFIIPSAGRKLNRNHTGNASHDHVACL